MPVITTWGIGRDFENLIRLPWTVTFHTEKFSEGVPGGALGLGLLALPLLVLIRPLSKWAIFLAAILLPFSVLWVYSGHQYLRYYLPALPLLCILVGYALASLGVSPWPFAASPVLGNTVRIIALTWVLATLPIYVAMYWNIPERVPLRVVFGQESRQAYLSRVLTAYDAYQFLDRRYPGQDLHILAIGDESRLYAPGTVEPLYSPVVRPLLLTSDPTLAMDIIREQGITHLLINRNGAPVWLNTFFLTQQSFLDRNTELEYADTNIYVYRFPAVVE